MPLRTISLDDGTSCTRMITSLHPDGAEFLPEKFTISSESAEGARIYNALERMINSITIEKNSGDDK